MGSSSPFARLRWHPRTGNDHSPPCLHRHNHPRPWTSFSSVSSRISSPCHAHFSSAPDPSPMSSSTSSLMNDIMSLNDEIDLLVDDTPPNSIPAPAPGLPPRPSSSAFDDLASWHNDYFQQPHFYSDLFSTNSNLSMHSPATNLDADNSTHGFTSNALTFM